MLSYQRAHTRTALAGTPRGASTVRHTTPAPSRGLFHSAIEIGLNFAEHACWLIHVVTSNGCKATMCFFRKSKNQTHRRGLVNTLGRIWLHDNIHTLRNVIRFYLRENVCVNISRISQSFGVFPHAMLDACDIFVFHESDTIKWDHAIAEPMPTLIHSRYRRRGKGSQNGQECVNEANATTRRQLPIDVTVYWLACNHLRDFHQRRQGRCTALWDSSYRI